MGSNLILKSLRAITRSTKGNAKEATPNHLAINKFEILAPNFPAQFSTTTVELDNTFPHSKLLFVFQVKKKEKNEKNKYMASKKKKRPFRNFIRSFLAF